MPGHPTIFVVGEGLAANRRPNRHGGVWRPTATPAVIDRPPCALSELRGDFAALVDARSSGRHRPRELEFIMAPATDPAIETARHHFLRLVATGADVLASRPEPTAGGKVDR